MKKVLLCAMAALMFASCQENNSELNASGEGRIAITASASGEVATRAESGIDIPAPALADFSLKITGQAGTVTESFEKSWTSLSNYRTDDERYLAGYYNVAISNGDATVEGYYSPCFTASQSIEVLNRNRTTNVELVATVANAIVLVQTTEAFDKYFPQSEFTVTTATNTITVDKDATEHLVIAPQNGVKVDCTCVRQSNLATGKTETLATQTIATAKAATRYIIKYDLSNAGGINVVITLNDSILNSTPVDTNTELNPNA